VERIKRGERLRKYNCENYDTCLDVAARGNFDFDCIGCDEKTIVSKNKKASLVGRHS